MRLPWTTVRPSPLRLAQWLHCRNMGQSTCACSPKSTCESAHSTHAHTANKANILREGKTHVIELENEGQCGWLKRKEREYKNFLNGVKLQLSNKHLLTRMTVWA